MNFKTTYILFGVLAIVLVVFGLILVYGPTSADSSNYVLPSLHGAESVPPTDITTVEITRPPDETIVFIRDPETKRWQISKPSELRADRHLIDQLVREVIDARKYERADISSNLSDLGLDDPQTVVTLKKGSDQEWKLNLGNERPGETTGVVYVTSSDRPRQPLAVKRSELESLFKTFNEYRSKDLLAGSGPGSFSDINYIQLNASKNELALKKSDGDRWRFDRPAYGQANYDEGRASLDQDSKKLANVKALAGALEGINVPTSEDFVAVNADDDTTRYGLQQGDPATLRIEIKRREGQDKPEKTQVLLIGKKVEAKDDKKPAPDMYYARLADEKAVVRVNGDSVKPIQEVVENPEVLRNRDLVQADLSKIDAVDIQKGDSAIKLRRPEASTWKVIADAKEPRKADFQTVQEILRTLTEKGQVKSFPKPNQEAELGINKPNAVVVSIWENGLQKEEKKDDKSAEKPDDKKPEGELKLKEEKPSVKLTFGNKDDNVVYVRREVGDEKMLLAVPAPALKQVDQPPLAYLDRTLPSFSESAEVTKLVLVHGGVTHEINKEKDKSPTVWKLAQPKDLEGRMADASKVENILSELRGLHTNKLVSEKPTEAEVKKYGLDAPQYKVTVTVLGDDKKPRDWVYLVGAETDEKNSWYARQGDRDLVFLAGPEVINTLKGDLVNRQIFAFDPAKVQELKLAGWKKVEKRTVTLHVERKSGDSKGWAIKNNLGDFQLDDSKVTNLASDLSRLAATEFVVYKKGPRPEYELGQDDKAMQIEIMLEGEKTPITLTLGKLNPDKKAYYAQSSALSGDVFLVPQDRFEKVLDTGLKYFSK